MQQLKLKATAVATRTPRPRLLLQIDMFFSCHGLSLRVLLVPTKVSCLAIPVSVLRLLSIIRRVVETKALPVSVIQVSLATPTICSPQVSDSSLAAAYRHRFFHHPKPSCTFSVPSYGTLQQSIKTKLHLQHSLREDNENLSTIVSVVQSTAIRIKHSHHCPASHCSGERQVSGLDRSET